MDVRSTSTMPATGFRWRLPTGEWHATIVSKATFDLRPLRSGLAEAQEPITHVDQHVADDPRRSLRFASDLLPFKSRSEVYVVGSVYAPRQRATRSVIARLVVGEIDKSLEIVCDRKLDREGRLHETPFVDMPLVYERAARGPEGVNPVGVVAGVNATGVVVMPNLMLPGQPHDKFDADMPACGFGAIPPRFPARVKFVREDAFEKMTRGFGMTDGIELDANLDTAFFNVAPLDQQVDEAFSPETRLILENLHPRIDRLVTTLAPISVTADLTSASRTETVPLYADTIVIDTERTICTVTFRTFVELVGEERDLAIVVATTQAQEDGDQERTITIGRRNAAKEKGPPLPVPPSPPKQTQIDPDPDTDDATPAPSPLLRNKLTKLIPGGRQETMEIEIEPEDLTHTGDEQLETSKEALPFRADMSPPSRKAPSLRAPPPSSAPMISSVLPAFQPPAPVAPAPPAARPIAPVLARPPAPVAASAAIASNSEASSPVSPLRSSGTRPLEIVSAAAVQQTPPAPAFVQPAPVRVGSGMGKPQPSSALDASNGALDPHRRGNDPNHGRPVEPRGIDVGSGGTPAGTAALELLWHADTTLPKARASMFLRDTLRDADNRRGFVTAPKEDPEARDRRDVVRLLMRGPMVEGLRFEESFTRSHEEDAGSTAPVIVVTGELVVCFDERDWIRAAAGFLSPFAPLDPNLKEAIEFAKAVVDNEWTGGPVLESAKLRLRDGHAKLRREVSQTPLETVVTRQLLERRKFRRVTMFGEERIRSELVPPGSRTGGAPIYLPAELSTRLPLFERLPVRAICELYRRQDETEPHSDALLVLALARVLPRSGKG